MSHPSILDRSEPLGRPFAGSLIFHALVIGTVGLSAYLSLGRREKWGDPQLVGGGVATITAVRTLRISPRHGPINQVANDTKSEIPAKPEKPKPAKVKPPDPAAIPLPSKVPKKSAPDRVASAIQHYEPPKPQPNQVYSSTGQSANSPMFSPAPGSGEIGSGASSPFGERLGWYEALLRDRVARNWHSEQLDSRLRTAPAAIVTFVLMRDGSIRSLRVSQSSGNFMLDQSAQRAIQQSLPFPALPPQFERDSANLEFVFRLQR